VGAFHTTTVWDVDELPAMFDAVVVNVYEPGVASVPESAPVDELIDKPGGKFPDIEYVALG
jgi:hypothetical protein